MHVKDSVTMSGKMLKKHLSMLLETYKSLPHDILSVKQHYLFAKERTKTAQVKFYAKGIGFVKDKSLARKYYDNDLVVFIHGIYDRESA